MKQPLVSIQLVTRDRAQFLSKAFEGILNQSYENWELIIIDDGSIDTTAEIVESFAHDKRIIFSRNEKNQGITFSRNKALQISKGTNVAVIDSDDVWIDPMKLEKQVAFLEQNPECVLVGSHQVICIDSEGKKIKEIHNPAEDNDIRNSFLYRNGFTHSSVMYRKSVADALGGYASYSVGEDYDLFLQMGLKGKMKNLPGLTVGYRIHGDNISLKKRMEALRLNIRIIKKYKANYPHYTRSIIRRYIRFALGLVLLRGR